MTPTPLPSQRGIEAHAKVVFARWGYGTRRTQGTGNTDENKQDQTRA